MSVWNSSKLKDLTWRDARNGSRPSRPSACRWSAPSSRTRPSRSWRWTRSVANKVTWLRESKGWRCLVTWVRGIKGSWYRLIPLSGTWMVKVSYLYPLLWQKINRHQQFIHALSWWAQTCRKSSYFWVTVLEKARKWAHLTNKTNNWFKPVNDVVGRQAWTELEGRLDSFRT